MPNVTDLNNPKGSNGLKSLGSFYWRDLYKNHSFPELGPNSIDMWYERLLYGRVDPEGHIIYPDEGKLKQLAGGGKTLFALNFVADAWEDLKKYVESAASRGVIDPDRSVYANLKPKKAWVSIHKAYHDWNDALNEVWDSTFIDSLRDQKIVSFDSFMNQYVQFVDYVSLYFPVTRSGFLASKFGSPMFSGLIIEFTDAKHGDDSLKYKGFILDTNFNFFRRAAERFGFFVDKNAPWRLVADLNSRAMKRYMRRHGATSKESMFKIYFHRSYRYELNLTKHYCVGWYNEYVAQGPMITKIHAGASGCSTRSELIERRLVTEEELEEKYPEDYWLRLYCFARARETRREWKQVHFDNIVKKGIEYRKFLDNERGMRYISDKFKKVRPPQRFEFVDLTDEQIQTRLKNR